MIEGVKYTSSNVDEYMVATCAICEREYPIVGDTGKIICECGNEITYNFRGEEMKITHHNYLQIDYCQHDWDRFYIGDVVEIKTREGIYIGEITEISDGYFVELWGNSKHFEGKGYTVIVLRNIKSIRKVEKQ